jgi:hypothetical protein
VRAEKQVEMLPPNPGTVPNAFEQIVFFEGDHDPEHRHILENQQINNRWRYQQQ